MRLYRGPSSRSRLRYHDFKRTVALTSLAWTSSPITTGYAFSLNQLPNVAEFTALFDEYRIKRVKMVFIPTWDSAELYNVTGASGVLLPNMYTAIDLNDTTGISTADLMEYDTFQMDQLNKPVVRWVRPSPKVDVLTNSGATSTSMDAGRQWLQCDANGINVPHYGLKVNVDNIGTAATNFFCRVFLTIYFECRGTK